MPDLLTFQPGVSLAEGRYLLRSAVQPGRWSVTIHGIRAQDLTAVIIKTPIETHGNSRFQAAWMRRTFLALRDLHHPSRARILDWFEQDGRPFLVMQKVKGPSLEQQLQQQGPLSEAIALQLIRQVAAGLAGIHSQGLLHRDIKPKNIILRQGVGIPTLVDWGLHLANGSADKLTPFSAPEQLQGGDIFKHRLDIYSLAATLYTAITGQVPLHPAQRQHQVPNPGPAALAGLLPPSQLQPDLSASTELAILQGMHLDPQQRPATLENWLQLFPLSHSPGSAAQERTDGPGKSTASGRTSPPATPSTPPGQSWATQPPPSQISSIPSSARAVSAQPFPNTNPPAFASSHGQATPKNPSPQPTAKPTPQAKTASPSLPERPQSPTPPGTNYVLGNTTGSLTPAHRGSAPAYRGSTPQPTAPPHPSEQQRLQQPNLGTVSPAQSSRNTGIASGHASPEGSSLNHASSVATSPPKAMVSAAPYPNQPPKTRPFKPIKRLTSISLLAASIGLAGGLLLRVLNPGSVAGFSGLGRVQNFPEADWPGETQLEDIPGDVPQPEYSGDRWDESEEAIPEVFWDEETSQDDVLAIPEEEQRPEEDQGYEAERYQAPQSTEDYAEPLEDPRSGIYDPENYSKETYAEETYAEDNYNEPAYDADYSDDGYSDQGYSDEYSEPPYTEDAASDVIEDDYDSEPTSPSNEETWSETEAWNEPEPWVEEAPGDWQEAPGDWQEAPSITADDFPEPELPPYEEAIPQGSIPIPPEEDVFYEDV